MSRWVQSDYLLGLWCGSLMIHQWASLCNPYPGAQLHFCSQQLLQVLPNLDINVCRLRRVSNQERGLGLGGRW